MNKQKFETLEDFQDALEELFNRTLPHGSGIDCKWEYVFYPNRVVCKNSFHNMNGNGYYCGYTNFKVSVSFEDLDIKIHGGTKNNKEYLDSMLYHWHTEVKADLADLVGINLIPKELAKDLINTLVTARKILIPKLYLDWADHIGNEITKIQNFIHKRNEV